MAATWIQLKVDAFGYTAGTTVKADDTDPAIAHLLNAGIAVVVANPGGNPPGLNSNVSGVAAGTAAASAAAVGTLSDAVGSLTATAPATGMSAGSLIVVTFTKPRPTVPRAVLISERNAASVGAYVSAKTATGFTIACRSIPSASQVITVDYHVMD